jgi:hypothetical protein
MIKDITIEPNPNEKENPDISYAVPSKGKVALTLDQHLNEVPR